VTSRIFQLLIHFVDPRSYNVLSITRIIPEDDPLRVDNMLELRRMLTER